MFDTRKTLHDRGILDAIKILSANGETGRLEMIAGKTEGAFFFKNGQLVDAHVGHLTGFQAVNAVASMRGARFTFDSSVVPPLVSSITPSERVVLKQFFGIETVAPHDAEESPVYPDDNEVTLEAQRIPVAALPPVVPDAPASKSLYRGGLILAALFLLIVFAAVALRNQYREHVLPASATTEQPATTTTEQPVTPVVAEEVKMSTTPAAAAEPPVAQKAQVAQNLTGKWSVVNTVQKTAYQSFEKLKIGFDLSINQSGNSFTGKGEKVSENGRSLPANSRTPIQVKGSINGDRIEATFFEEGALRKTNGRFVWRIDKAGALTGTFVSTAAGSSGKSAARREL